VVGFPPYFSLFDWWLPLLSLVGKFKFKNRHY
jgi:hypothetical protein